MGTPQDDGINHPAHYGGDTTYEAIKVIEAWGLGFHLGNAVKYICRAGRKPTADKIHDLQKARWYLDRLIAELYQQQPRLPGNGATGPLKENHQ